MTKVVTYQSSDALSRERISICPDCEQRLLAEDAWPRDARHEEMVDVYIGLHSGECEAPGHGRRATPAVQPPQGERS